MVNSGLSLGKAARLTGAPKEKIRRRKSGIVARGDMGSHGPQQLTDHEEAALVDFILQMEFSGFSLRRSNVEDSTMALLLARWDENTPPPSFGDRWFSRFIERQSKLSSRTKGTLSGQRTKGLSKANAEHSFNILRDLVQRCNLTAKDIFSMDETGVQHGVYSKKFKYAGSSKSRKEVETTKQ
ncbi:hypothetical protein CF326_g4584, partial [Tilletia indica]